MLSEVEVPFATAEGNIVARLWIADRGGKSIDRLSDAEAEMAQEAPIQLVEGHIYDYELRGAPDGMRLRGDEITQPNLARRNVGRIETGLHAGMLPIVLLSDDRIVSTAVVEVRTFKIGYREHYRLMLDRIADASVALIMNARAPAAARMSTDPHLDARTAHQRLAFVRAALSSQAFKAAVERVIRMPHERSAEDLEERDIRRGLKSSASVAKQIASARQRVLLPQGHALRSPERRQPLFSVPARIVTTRRTATVDTPENRFVKHALSEFLRFLEFIGGKFAGSSPADLRIAAEVRPLRTMIASWLGHDLFGEISELRVLPLSSSVLQRRPGYREVLRTWLAFQLACRLNWKGGEDVFAAGKKDVPTLYEYWVLFELLEIVRAVFDLDRRPEEVMVETTDDHLDLNVKRAFHLSFEGTYSAATRRLRIDFSYNRTFSRRGSVHDISNYPADGSWSKAMRPDFSLSLWPAEYKRDEAERQELIAHVHFDAKYRIESLKEVFGDEATINEPSDDEDLRPSGIAKRDDLLKMHAYRDAIRRSEGAYVIYPGSLGNELQVWQSFHEVLPGLGAFALRPGAVDAGSPSIREFLIDVARHVCDEATRREQLSYHRFRIEEPTGAYRARVELPREDPDGERLRPQPPEERS